jgi:acyl dehydratase
MKGDYHIERTYDNVTLDLKAIKKFSDFFGIKAKIPAAYFFTLTMRSQLALMCDKTFPFPLMGIVHLTNTINVVGDLDPKKPVDLETIVDLPYKEEGSLFPEVAINIKQNGKTVIKCTSSYIKIRKRKGPKIEKKAEEVPARRKADYTEELKYADNIGWKYAAVSGDYNPIHLIGAFAKSTGFPSTIAHGWCSLTKVFTIIEKQTGKDLKNISVAFKTPVPIPNTLSLELYNNEDGSTDYAVYNKKGELNLEGTIS